jgi:hypothetical protein
MSPRIKITGSIYAPGEPAVLYAQVLDAAGNPVATATVTLNLFRVDGSKVLDNVNMPYIPGTNGIYQYEFTAPSGIERLVADVKSTAPTAYGIEDIYVPQWALRPATFRL